MAKQICKDCAGRGWIAGPLYAMEGSYKCPTCDGTGTKHRTGPYRLADGTWSDGVDRGEPLSVWTLPNGRWQVYQCESGYWEAYAESDGQQLDEIRSFPTHAEAIAYADRTARTTKNGDNK